MENPLEQPAPEDPIARVHEFARDLAWGVLNGKWNGVFSKTNLNVKRLSEPYNYRNPNIELILYIKRKWSDEQPDVELMQSFEYFTVTQESLVPRGNLTRLGEPGYRLTPKAFALLEMPTFSPYDATVTYKYMEMAEQLLDGLRPEHVHIPAAVLAGIKLEIGLRHLCQRQSPPLETMLENGKPKRLNKLIEELQGKAFNPLKGDQLKSWAKIRNAAGHGEIEKFNRGDVVDMIAGIKRFLAESEL